MGQYQEFPQGRSAMEGERKCRRRRILQGPFPCSQRIQTETIFAISFHAQSFRLCRRTSDCSSGKDESRDYGRSAYGKRFHKEFALQQQDHLFTTFQRQMGNNRRLRNQRRMGRDGEAAVLSYPLSETGVPRYTDIRILAR